MPFPQVYTVLSPIIFAYRSRRVRRDFRRVFGLQDRLLRRQRKAFKRMKSFSCPQLVLTSCNSLPGPGASPANLKACRSFADMKARFLLSLPVGSASEDQTGTATWESSRGEAASTHCSEACPMVGGGRPRRLSSSCRCEESAAAATRTIARPVPGFKFTVSQADVSL